MARRIFLSLILLLLVAFCFVSCDEGLDLDDTQDEPQTSDSEDSSNDSQGESITESTDKTTDTNTDETKNESSSVVNTSTSAPKPTFPQFSDITISPYQTEVEVDFYNPEENKGKYYLRFQLYLENDGENDILYTSDLVSSGSHINMITLAHGLEAGVYEAKMLVDAYKIDETIALTNKSTFDIALNVQFDPISLEFDQTEIAVDFCNPESNAGKYYLTYELYLENDDGSKDVLYKSGLLSSGNHVRKITLVHTLAAGEYQAKVHVQAYTMDGSLSSAGSSTSDIVINVTNTSGFVPITENNKAYMLMSVNVRTNYKKSATNGAAMYGSEVVRIETNDTWTKIKYTDSNGATKEGYVYDEVLTIDAGRVGYAAEETPVQATSNTNAGTVRKVPWIGEKYNTVIDEINGVNGDEYKLKKDQAVEILGKTETADDSGNKWAYIKYVVGEKTVYGWCRMDLLNAGESVDTPVADPTVPSIPNPI